MPAAPDQGWHGWRANAGKRECAHGCGDGVGDRARSRPGLLCGARAAVRRRRRTHRDDHARSRRPPEQASPPRGQRAVVVGVRATGDVGCRDRAPGCRSPVVRVRIHRQHRHRVPHEQGGRVGAGHERPDLTSTDRAGTRRPAVGGALRLRDSDLPVPQGTAGAERAGAALPHNARGRLAAAGARHGVVAARAAGARRRCRARTPRGRAEAAARRGARGAALARGGHVGGRAQHAPRTRMARAALHRARHLRRGDRRGRARLRRP